ncbi:hypothetical protein [Achromobacter aloeverae]
MKKAPTSASHPATATATTGKTSREAPPSSNRNGASARQPAARPDDPSGGPVSVRVDWTLHEADQHPQVQDVLVGNDATLWVRGYTGPTGGTLAETTPTILWEAFTRPFGNAVYPLSTATVSSYYVALAQPQSGVVTAESVSDPDSSVPVVDPPDYGVAYVVAHDIALQAPPLDANTLPYAGLFKVRVWKAPTAVLSTRSGDGTSAAFNRYFEAPISVKIADSTGSTQGTHGMAVRFDIIGDATFDQAGSNQRFATISATSAQVFCEYGAAYAPRIKAGGTLGTIQVSVSSKFATQQIHFILHVVDPQGPADAAYVTAQQGDDQDQLAGSKFTTLLQAKVDNKSKNPAAAGNVVFTVYPATDGQPLALAFDKGDTTSTSISVAVDEGYATATPLNAIAGAFPAAGYVTNLVCAYADTYDTQNNDPRTDDSGQVGRFTERVWNGAVASLARDDGKNGQTTAPGQFFPTPLTATVHDAASTPQPVARTRVTFALQGPGQFEATGSAPVEQWSPTSVIVATDEHGVATAPRIQAVRGQSGAITATLSCLASADQPTYTMTSVVPSDEGVSIGLGSGDLQDQVVHVPFASPMTVTVRNAQGDNATSGQITFTCQATSDAAGSFNGATSADAPVNNGAAVAPTTLQGDNVLQKTESYGYFEVVADTPHSTHTYTFRQRVWRSKHALLTAVSGDTNNKAKPGELFPIPVVAHVAGPDNEDIENLLVTFSLQGPAQFVYASAPEQAGDAATSATVRTDKSGLANAPGIKAGDVSGSVTVTADATVAQAALPFGLTVLPTSTASTTVYADPAADFQDTMTGGAYAVPLSVSVKNSSGADATTGTVTFKIYNGTASGRFADETDDTQCVVPVANGHATATTLRATTNSATGSFSVVAYPTDTFHGDPQTDTSDQTAHFTERVWDEVHINLNKTEGDDQHTDKGQYFPERLRVQAVDSSKDNAPVPQYLVTFTVSTTDLATFDLSDPTAPIVSGDSHSVTVRGGEDGHAVAPRLLAAATTGAVAVQAHGTVDAGANFNLTIDNELPAIYTLKPDANYKKVLPNSTAKAIFTLLDGNRKPVPGQFVQFSLDQPGIVSFSPNDPHALTADPVQTDAAGEASVDLYAGNTMGTANLKASNVQSTDGYMSIVVAN